MKIFFLSSFKWVLLVMIIISLFYVQNTIYATGQCTDGIDNDLDTFIDSSDSDCLGTWSVKQNMPTPRSGVAAATTDSFLYVVGGRSSDFPENNLTAIERYNPVANMWDILTPMNQGRLAPVMEAINGRLYAISGLYKVGQEGISNVLNSIEEYNPDSDTWVYKAPIPTGRYGASSAALNNRIYVVGGSNGIIDTLDKVEVYNVTTDTWKTVAPMPTSRTLTGSVAFQEKIYVAGGQDIAANSLNIVEVYDPLTDSWSVIKDLPIPFVSPGVSVVNGALYVYGGHYRDVNGAGIYINKMYEYIPDSDDWVEKETMVTPRSQFGYASLDKKIYTIGGGTYNGQAIFHNNLEVFTPSVSEGIRVVPEVDPLVLKYMPVLAMWGGEGERGEDYLPMGVDIFVDGSALWDKSGKDTQLKNVDELSFGEFESIVGSTDTSEYYLAYSAPDTAKTIDLEAAKTKYDASNPETTVYYRKMVDGDYTVLQYWYFYAMNNWKERGGFNNHEGDWESVFVYLDSSDEIADPKYVGYSAHHDDGDPTDRLLQTGSVRRGWNSSDVTKENGKPISYVALGSHANYPNLNGGVYKTGTKNDIVSDGGTRLRSDDFTNKTEIQSTTPFWMNYEGMWGADSLDIYSKSSGPLGPLFNNVSDYKRFTDPVAWAGIDKIREVTISAPTKDIALDDTGVSMEFDGRVPVGTTLKVEPYDEWISFGQTEENVVLLPKFWDITSSLKNGTFEAEVQFMYDPIVVEKLGGDQEDLKVFFYNNESLVWEIQESVVDTKDRFVSFETSHFSRYALGFEKEEISLGDLFDTLVVQIKDTSIKPVQKRHLVRYVKFIEKFAAKEHKYAKRITKKLLKRIEKRIKRYERRGVISKQEKEVILETIDEIKKYLKNKDT